MEKKMEKQKKLFKEIPHLLAQALDVSFAHERMIECQELNVPNLARPCATYIEKKLKSLSALTVMMVHCESK
ncbi:hypothetical protein QE152_g31965 [Popillia japonica]|uniref:Uncharacterized protein n=1 Tax=Popillia japonica TaxID=7064 RepID=A0AAW1J1A8_POPJA